MLKRWLPLLTGCLLMSSAWASLSNGGIDYPSVWSCDDAKFHWYCDNETEVTTGPVKPIVKNKSKEEAALEELEQMRKSLEAKRALALMQPTPENLKAYITAQEALMDRASVFSDVWRRVIWANPEINYQLRNPVNNAAIQVRDSERTQKERSSLKEIAKEWGIFFVFRTDCPYCHRMAPALKLLSDTYGITIFPVSLDGGALPDFPKPAMDNGMAKVLDVKQVPYVALGNIKDRRLIPLGSGVLSVQDMVERIYILTQTQPGDLY
jgi:conjugal transfer pilus assembly protein TraF